MNNGVVEITGQSEAVKNAQALELKRQEEMTDAFGNTVKVRLPPRASSLYVFQMRKWVVQAVGAPKLLRKGLLGEGGCVERRCSARLAVFMP